MRQPGTSRNNRHRLCEHETCRGPSVPKSDSSARIVTSNVRYRSTRAHGRRRQRLGNKNCLRGAGPCDPLGAMVAWRRPAVVADLDFRDPADGYFRASSADARLAVGNACRCAVRLPCMPKSGRGRRQPDPANHLGISAGYVGWPRRAPAGLQLRGWHFRRR